MRYNKFIAYLSGRVSRLAKAVPDGFHGTALNNYKVVKIMGGFFGAVAKDRCSCGDNTESLNCVYDVFYGTDYHSHLGTRRAGMVMYGEKGFDRAIHNIEN